jgi:hypothetical protein
MITKDRQHVEGTEERHSKRQQGTGIAKDKEEELTDNIAKEHSKGQTTWT